MEWTRDGVALPGSRGIRIGWLQLLTFLPSPHGLLPLLTGNWALYADHPDVGITSEWLQEDASVLEQVVLQSTRRVVSGMALSFG